MPCDKKAWELVCGSPKKMYLKVYGRAFGQDFNLFCMRYRYVDEILEPLPKVVKWK